jgi:hypothetical protein
VMLASTLTACAVSAPSNSVGIHLPALPSKYLTTSCAPTVLPKGPLTRSQVEKLWARDRVLLVKCGYSLGGLTKFYVDLSRQLSAADTRK